MDSTTNKSAAPVENALVPGAASGRDLTYKLLRFMIAGVPTFLVALPMNWFLVDQLELPKSGTYACVLLAQTTVNFFICRWFVFREESRKPMLSRFIPFLAGVLFFRAADWGLYTLLVSFTGLWYLGVQLGNAVLFMLLKFAFVRRVMEK